MEKSEQKTIYLRNFVFGVEDSLVSTVGLLSGIAAVNTPRTTILLTGTVLIFVEAFSMAAGSFLTEHSVEDYLHEKSGVNRRSLRGGLAMFLSYFISGFIPLLPYLFFETPLGLVVSIIVSLFALFILSLISAKMANVKPFRVAVRMLLIGGVAIVVGITIGKLLWANL